MLPHCRTRWSCLLRPVLAAGLIGLLAALAGCASAPHAYQRPGATESEMRRDYARCQQQAQLEALQESSQLYGFGFTRPGFVPGQGWVMRPGDPPGASFWRVQREQELADYCMRVLGYRWLPQPGGAPPPAAAPVVPPEIDRPPPAPQDARPAPGAR